MFSANVDASLGRRYAGIGYTIFKDKQIIYKRRQRVPRHDSNTLEYIALLELLKSINKLEIKDVKINTDCKSIEDDIHKVNSGVNRDKSIMRDIIYELSLNPTLNVKWIPREKNVAAHNLCRQSMKGRRDLEYDQPIIELKNRLNESRLKRTKEIIGSGRSLMKVCCKCHELKSRTEFPRKTSDGCITCKKKLDQIQSATKQKIHIKG